MKTSFPARELNRVPLTAFRELFAALVAPTIAGCLGIYQAEFVGPAWLRKIAGPGLWPLGLGGWWGKQFDGWGQGTNIVKRKNELSPFMPIEARQMPSLIDGRPALTVIYPPDSRFPWPWVIDELRHFDERSLLGMTMIKVSPLHNLALPFLLHHRRDASLKSQLVDDFAPLHFVARLHGHDRRGNGRRCWRFIGRPI